jgi:hypothetical protein
VSGVLPPDEHKKGANTVGSIHSALITTGQIMTNSADIIKFPVNPEKVLINQRVDKIINNLGWVYVLTNDSMPNIVKIGHTTQNPYARAKQLSQAKGVPQPFDVSYAVNTLMFAELEARAHHLLAGYRVNDSREFFYQKPCEAFDLIMDLAEQVKYSFCTSELKIGIYEAAIKRANIEYGGLIENQSLFDMEGSS